jgi:hypothetical protein
MTLPYEPTSVVQSQKKKKTNKKTKKTKTKTPIGNNFMYLKILPLKCDKYK